MTQVPFLSLTTFFKYRAMVNQIETKLSSATVHLLNKHASERLAVSSV